MECPLRIRRHPSWRLGKPPLLTLNHAQTRSCNDLELAGPGSAQNRTFGLMRDLRQYALRGLDAFASPSHPMAAARHCQNCPSSQRLPVFIGDLFWLHGPVRRLVVFVCFSRRRRRLHIVRFMMGGRVNRIDLHWRRADIGDVVPGSRRYEDAPAVRHFLFKIQFILGRAHLHATAAGVETQKLVGLRMRFKANIFPRQESTLASLADSARSRPPNGNLYFPLSHVRYRTIAAGVQYL